jgi:NADH dehydrogenase FAD-containing subunit
MRRRPSVIIVGGGFGGLSAAQALKSAPVDVTLIDRNNFTCFSHCSIKSPPDRFRLARLQPHCAAS